MPEVAPIIRIFISLFHDCGAGRSNSLHFVTSLYLLAETECIACYDVDKLVAA